MIAESAVPIRGVTSSGLSYEARDNVLEPLDLANLDVILSDQFPWFFNDAVVDRSSRLDSLNDFQFTHNFYKENQISSQFFQLIQPFFRVLDIACLLRVKANLQMKTEVRFFPGFHVDQVMLRRTKSAVFYLNTNDGVTRMKIDGEMRDINTVRNRLLIFDNLIEHSGSTCTDQKYRCVLNFNFIDKQFLNAE